jgi:hypothetical protein
VTKVEDSSAGISILGNAGGSAARSVFPEKGIQILGYLFRQVTLPLRRSGGSGISRRAATASSFRPPSPRRGCLSRCRAPTGSPALPERLFDQRFDRHVLEIFSNSRSGGSPILWLRSCRCRNVGYVGCGGLPLSAPYGLIPSRFVCQPELAEPVRRRFPCPGCFYSGSGFGSLGATTLARGMWQGRVP